MNFRGYFAIGLSSLAFATAGSLCLEQSSDAQGLRSRLQERRAESQNSDQSQNPNQNQQNSGQQNYNQNSMPQQGSAQNAGPSDVSMVTLQVQPGAGGQQMVVTPKGMVVPLPGPGVDSSVVHVYIGAQGGYWYVDKNNQQVDLTGAVRAMQNAPAQPQQAAPVPQYAPPPQYNTYNNNGSSAMGTAAAAGLGAMTGAAIASNSNWNNVPYGTPIHYGAGASPYYNQGGKPVYVNNSTNTANINASQNYAATANHVDSYHANTMQQQQDWYKKQQAQQSGNWKNWQEHTTAANPFVNSDYQAGGRYAQQTAGNSHAGGVEQAEGGHVEHNGEQSAEAARGRRGGQSAEEGGRFRRGGQSTEEGGARGERSAEGGDRGEQSAEGGARGARGQQSAERGARDRRSGGSRRGER